MYLFRCYIAGSSRGIASLGKSTRSARRNRKVARTRNWTRESKTTQIQNRKVRFSWFVFIRFENWHVHLNVNDNLGFHQLSCSLRFQGKYSEWIYLNIWYDTCWSCSSGIWIVVWCFADSDTKERSLCIQSGFFWQSFYWTSWTASWWWANSSWTSTTSKVRLSLTLLHSPNTW